MKKILIFFACCISQYAHGQHLTPTLDKITNKYGYKEKNKIEWSLPPTYKEAHFFGNKIAIVSDGDFYYAINLHGEKVSPNFKSIEPTYNRDLRPFVCQDTNGKYQLYDAQFNPISPTSYQDISCSGEDVLFFKIDNQYGLMDLEGNILIPPVYKELSFDNYYYTCGFKKCDKDGINSDMFKQAFIEAKNQEGKYGIITLNNEIIVPFTYSDSYKVKYKGVKGAYKKVIKPYLLSTKKQALDMRIKEAKIRISTKNKELATIYPTDLPVVEKTIIKETKSGYAFFKANKQISKTYQNIDSYDKYCIISNNNKYGIADPLGNETVACEYDNISLWNIGIGDDVLLVEKDNKHGLINADGTELSARNCDMIFLPIKNAGVAKKNGLYWLIDSKGNLISKYGYDNIDNYSTDNKIYAEKLGYKTELSIDGTEYSPIIKQIFDEAYNMPISDNAQKKYDKYMLCSSLDMNNQEGYRALSLNNIGSMFEDLGNEDKAIEYYEQARNLGNETARKNIKRIKLNRTLNALQQVGDALTQVAQTIDTSGSYTSLQQNSSNYGTFNGNNSTDLNGNTNKHSYDFWKQQYDRWERNAKSCYESLTNTGYKIKKNGQDKGGGAAGSWGTVSFSGMKSNLRKAQKEMRDTRAKARKEGHNIPQSNYETINVSF
ncbi:MAG: WG repeat-containing protein [Paraprevotella sp.]|nr:WG repeat-containing protein [Paraprevotella sp.]